MIEVKLGTIDAHKNLEFVRQDDLGGLCQFVGTVRNHHKGKEVVRLEFEAYEPMAIKELEKIAQRAVETYGISHISIHHALGNRLVGQDCVVIAVGSAHRKAAFDACQFAINELKKTVPIWKKEVLIDGEFWVSDRP